METMHPPRFLTDKVMLYLNHGKCINPRELPKCDTGVGVLSSILIGYLRPDQSKNM